MESAPGIRVQWAKDADRRQQTVNCWYVYLCFCVSRGPVVMVSCVSGCYVYPLYYGVMCIIVSCVSVYHGVNALRNTPEFAR